MKLGIDAAKKAGGVVEAAIVRLPFSSLSIEEQKLTVMGVVLHWRRCQLEEEEQVRPRVLPKLRTGAS